MNCHRAPPNENISGAGSVLILSPRHATLHDLRIPDGRTVTDGWNSCFGIEILYLKSTHTSLLNTMITVCFKLKRELL